MFDIDPAFRPRAGAGRVQRDIAARARIYARAARIVWRHARLQALS